MRNISYRLFCWNLNNYDIRIIEKLTIEYQQFADETARNDIEQFIINFSQN